MIRREQVIDVLLEACPSYRARWKEYTADPVFDAELLYVHLGDFAGHLVDLIARGETAELPAVGAALETLHLDGDDFVKETATIGLLEDIQNAAGNRGVATKVFEETLGVETRRWWNSLVAFWSGKIPHVGADITKGSN